MNPYTPARVLPLLDATRWNWPFASRSWVPVQVPSTWDYCMIPSERPLYAILADIVQHGVDNPMHGTDCACLDQFVYELRAHVNRALPDREYILREDWDGTTFQDETRESREARQDAQWRVAHVLNSILRLL